MKVTYDSKTDILNIIFTETLVAESDEDKPGVILDYDDKGNLVSLEIMDISVHFNNQPRLVTVKINDESMNDLLSPNTDSQLLGTNLLPQNLFGRSHLTAQFFCAFQFFFGDFLTWDDIFERHGLILIQNLTPALS